MRWLASSEELQEYAALQARQVGLEQDREAWWLKMRGRLNIPDDVTIKLDPDTGRVTKVKQ